MARPLAAQQFDVLRRIFDLSRAQRACIEQDEFDRLAELMDQRDRLVADLQRLVEEEASLPDNVVAFRVPEDHTQQDSLALDTVIRGILEHDSANEALLAQRMRLILDELPTFRQGQRAIAGYRSANPEAVSFMNRVS